MKETNLLRVIASEIYALLLFSHAPSWHPAESVLT